MRKMVARGKLKGSGKIGVRVGKVVNKYKVAKHFDLTITDHNFKFSLLRKQIAAEGRSMASMSSVQASSSGR